MPVRTVNIPDELDERIEKLVKNEFGNKRSKAYTALLERALKKDNPIEDKLSKGLRKEVESLIDSKLMQGRGISSDDVPEWRTE